MVKRLFFVLCLALTIQASGHAWLEDRAHTSGDLGVLSLTVRTDTATSSAGTSGDYSTLNTDNLGYLYVNPKGYDSGTDSLKVSEVSPISAHHSESTLLNLTNIAANTTGYAYFDMDGYRYFTLQGITSGTTPTDTLTVSIEATLQDDGTLSTACAYSDVTQSWFSVPGWVDANFWAEKHTPVSAKYIRVKYVTSDTGTNDADFTCHLKKMY